MPIDPDMMKAVEAENERLENRRAYQVGVAVGKASAMRETEAAIAEARREALREAAYQAKHACLVPPDGGSPTKAEADLCDEAERRILALLDAEAPAQPKPDAAQEALEWAESQRMAALTRADISAPEDDAVRLLCERHGYGAVMDSASRQWVRKDSSGAFYIGGCVGDTSFKTALRALAGGDAND